MIEPENVQAVFRWYEKHHPDLLDTIRRIFVHDISMETFQALILQGFEAGREFERENPGVTEYI